MSESSQNPTEPWPPEGLHDPRPLQDAAASYAAVVPVPAGSSPDRLPAVVTGAAGVLRAAMEQGSMTPLDLAQAQHDRGILFDPERAQAIADAAREQALAECAADLAGARQDREALEWFHERCRAVGRLCDDRRPEDLLKVGEVLAAVDGRAPRALPLTIRWSGQVTGPAGDGPGETTLVGGTTARGGRAVLVLTEDERLRFGELLLSTVHTAEACTTPGCGMSGEDLDASDPTVSGWILVGVAGTETGPRWWCSPLCAQAAMAAAGAELAAADRAAALDPHQQAPEQHPYGDPLAYGPTGIPCGCGKPAHSNLVPCQPDSEDEAVRRSVDAQFPAVAAFLAEERGERP
ncbi:hypothetical protein [Streptomyces sp. G1]|uniref:hypothetical protein n=1 Tax=Streptomyces sp. G1 TaxID=361572 RepID=UPI00202FC6B7|nr:hypothetical protein [Streptomyces sp. G1]MCM1976801.1 hypothetical protein [Streptomyces sp. G1]